MSSVSAGEAAFVRDLVYKRSAIVLEESKRYLIEARLEPLAQEQGFASIDALVHAAKLGEPALQTRVVEALTTNETSFYRDLSPFDCLRKVVLPQLMAARVAKRELTIWCAASSTGQEPYSIAMLIAEHLPELLTWPVRILATDLSEPILARAREGKYRQLEINRGLPATHLLRYFDRVGTEWQLKPELRGRVEFSKLNLIDAWKIVPRPDVVFIRNVLIYFDNARKRSILERVRAQLAPDGALFLGSTETTMDVDDCWERVAFERTAFYRVRSQR
jgi:chemotaxis protein methyltransferase CheR